VVSSRPIRKDDLLRILGGRKQSTDRVAGKSSGKEEPVDSAIQRKFGCRTGKDQENSIGIAPDCANDGVGGNKGWRRFDGQRYSSLLPPDALPVLLAYASPVFIP
jgi:hypothetical protein